MLLGADRLTVCPCRFLFIYGSKTIKGADQKNKVKDALIFDVLMIKGQSTFDSRQRTVLQPTLGRTCPQNTGRD